MRHIHLMLVVLICVPLTTTKQIFSLKKYRSVDPAHPVHHNNLNNGDKPRQRTSDSSEVIFTSIIFRHGARTPNKIFKGDPNIDLPIWNEWGLGQLTNVGKMQHYDLGVWLRKRYRGLISQRYRSEEINVRSTDVDRTLMGAYCTLAGLYPAEGDQIWNPNIPTWQPIPVHTTASQQDNVLAALKPCSKYTQTFNELMSSDEMKRYDESIAPLCNNLSIAMDLKITKRDFIKLHDLLTYEKENNLEWPVWVNNDLYQQLGREALFAMRVPSLDFQLQRLKVGVLMHEMIGNMFMAVNGSGKKMQVYSAHDGTLVNVMQALGVPVDAMPPYASAIMFDLHKHTDNGLSVSIGYKNSTGEPYLLKLPECSLFCDLDRFVELTRGVTMNADEWERECQMEMVVLRMYESEEL